MTDKEVMQMVLDALESLQAWPETPENFKRFRAIEALRTALAQPEQYDQTELNLCKKCGWKAVWPDGCLVCEKQEAQPEKEWVGLTDDELHALHFELKVQTMGGINTLGMYRILEAKLKEKNT